MKTTTVVRTWTVSLLSALMAFSPGKRAFFIGTNNANAASQAGLTCKMFDSIRGEHVVGVSNRATCLDTCATFMLEASPKATVSDCVFVNGQANVVALAGRAPTVAGQPTALCAARADLTDPIYEQSTRAQCLTICTNFKANARPDEGVTDCMWFPDDGKGGQTIDIVLAGRGPISKTPGEPCVATSTGQPATMGPDSAIAKDPCLASEPFRDPKDYVAVKTDDQMLIQKELQAKEASIDQKDSFTVTSNVMHGCVETALNGRSDDVCLKDPMHPECLGLSKALQQGTTCKEYFVPKELGCKVYGSGSLNMEEWMAIGSEFHAAIKQCADTKVSADSHLDELKSKTDMIIWERPADLPEGRLSKATVSGGPSDDVAVAQTGDPVAQPSAKAPAVGSGASRMAPAASTHTEDRKRAQMEVASALAKYSEELDDGAQYLGYQKGDLIRAIARGESYADFVANSPFADDLNALHKNKLDQAMAEPHIVAERVIESKGHLPPAPEFVYGSSSSGDKHGGRSLASVKAEPEDPSRPGFYWNGVTAPKVLTGQVVDRPVILFGQITAAPMPTVPSPKMSSVSGDGRKPSLLAQAWKAVVPSSAPAFQPRKMLEVERQANVASHAYVRKAQFRALAALKKGEKVDPITPAEDLVDEPLFSRVNYRLKKKSRYMRSLQALSQALEKRPAVAEAVNGAK